MLNQWVTPEEMYMRFLESSLLESRLSAIIFFFLITIQNSQFTAFQMKKEEVIIHCHLIAPISSPNPDQSIRVYRHLIALVLLKL